MRRRLSFLASSMVLALFAASPASASNDPGFKDQYGLAKIGAEQAWGTAVGSGVIIAIVDTGVDLSHEDLKDKIVAGRNFVEGDDTPAADDNGHGTHVSGIAAASTGNGVGVAGVAPAARIMPVRVLQDAGDGSGNASGNTSDIEEGIKWAVDHGARVVNLSLGEDVLIRTVTGGSLTDALDYAWSKGAVPVIAAGNDFLFPSGYRDANAIVVAATDQQDRKASFSNGVGMAKWGMSAPGAGILSTWRSNQYATVSGTSMSVPHVAGAAALLMSMGMTNRQTVDRLLATAKDLGAEGHDSTYGSGRLDAAKAVGSPVAVVPESAKPRPAPGTTPKAVISTPKPGPGRGPVQTSVTTETSPPPSDDPVEVVDVSPKPLAAPIREDGSSKGLIVLAALTLAASLAAAIMWRRARFR